MKRKGKFEIFKDSCGEIRFRFKAGNGEIVCQSEGYASVRGARRGIDFIQWNASSCMVVDLTKK